MKVHIRRAWAAAWFTIPYWSILASIVIATKGHLPPPGSERTSVLILFLVAEFLLIKSRIMKRGFAGFDRLAVPLTLTNVAFALAYTLVLGFYFWPEWVATHQHLVRILNIIARGSIIAVVVWSIFELLRLEPPDGEPKISKRSILISGILIVNTIAIYISQR